MEEKVKVSAVGYLNAKPLIYGLEHLPIGSEIHLSLDAPAECAEKLISGKADIGLVPIAVIPLLGYAQILGEYCIGAVGAVSSVMLYSNVPLEEIQIIHLDYQSRSSVKLVQVLAKNFWKISPEWHQAKPGYEENLGDKEAALIIGDRTFGRGQHFKYLFDLAQEWTHFTGLPFVFACWIANKPLDPDFINRFEAAVAYGVTHKELAIQEWTDKNQFPVDVREYLGKYISYPLDEEKKKGMAHFLELLAQL